METSMKKGVDYTGITIVFFCHDGNGKYVLQKRGPKSRDEQGTWDCGGGSLEVHHTIEGTLRKEIDEELGAEVISYEFLGYRDVHREHEGVKTHWLALDFKVLVDPATVTNKEKLKGKCDEIGWFKLGDFPSPLHSQFPTALVQHEGKL